MMKTIIRKVMMAINVILFLIMTMQNSKIMMNLYLKINFKMDNIQKIMSSCKKILAKHQIQMIFHNFNSYKANINALHNKNQSKIVFLI